MAERDQNKCINHSVLHTSLPIIFLAIFHLLRALFSRRSCRSIRYSASSTCNTKSKLAGSIKRAGADAEIRWWRLKTRKSVGGEVKYTMHTTFGGGVVFTYHSADDTLFATLGREKLDKWKNTRNLSARKLLNTLTWVYRASYMNFYTFSESPALVNSRTTIFPFYWLSLVTVGVGQPDFLFLKIKLESANLQANF